MKMYKYDCNCVHTMYYSKVLEVPEFQWNLYPLFLICFIVSFFLLLSLKMLFFNMQK